MGDYKLLETYYEGNVPMFIGEGDIKEIEEYCIKKKRSDEKSTEKPQKRIYRKRDEIIVEEKKMPKKSARIETKVVRVSSSSTMRYSICSACKRTIESKHKNKRKCPYCGIAWEKEQK